MENINSKEKGKDLLSIAKSLCIPVSLFVFSSMLTPYALAFGIGIAPSYIDIQDAAKGQSYDEGINIFNRFTVETEFEINATGDISQWVAFYDYDTGERIWRVIIGPSESKVVKATITIPSDTANGVYNGTVQVRNIPPSGQPGQNVQTVSFVASSQARIAVAGTQKLEGLIKSWSARDIEQNRNLDIIVYFENTGNVQARPRIKAEILKGGEKVGEVQQDNETIGPGQTGTIHVYWSSYGMNVGNYTARMSAFLGPDMLLQEEKGFLILERGSFTAKAELSSFTKPDKTGLSRPAKIEAEVRNIGELEINARLACEVYSGSELIDVLNSDYVLIQLARKETLSLYFKNDKAGRYSFECSITYEGKKLEIEGFEIEVIKDETVTDESILKTQVAGQEIIRYDNDTKGSYDFFGMDNPYIIYAAAAVVLIIIIALMVAVRKRKMAETSSDWEKIK